MTIRGLNARAAQRAAYDNVTPEQAARDAHEALAEQVATMRRELGQ